MRNVVMVLFLSMAVVANAGLRIYVKIGENFWADYADSKLVITPGTTIQLGVMDITGQTLPLPETLALGVANGPASLNAGSVVALQGVSAMMQSDAAAAAEFGVRAPFVSLEITSPTQIGMLVRSIFFHCDGPGDATIALVDDDGFIVDSQVVHQIIPEPATMMLLGLGGVLAAAIRKKHSV
jgi:hypothetical protein